MQAILVRQFGGPEVFELAEVPEPQQVHRLPATGFQLAARSQHRSRRQLSSESTRVQNCNRDRLWFRCGDV